MDLPTREELEGIANESPYRERSYQSFRNGVIKEIKYLRTRIKMSPLKREKILGLLTNDYKDNLDEYTDLFNQEELTNIRLEVKKGHLYLVW
jgi:hypothetical protein